MYSIDPLDVLLVEGEDLLGAQLVQLLAEAGGRPILHQEGLTCGAADDCHVEARRSAGRRRLYEEAGVVL